MFRSRFVEMNFNFSVANPTFISSHRLDGLNMGGEFTFYDALGINIILGKRKKVNFNLKIAHYSNGNLLENNPGVWVPLMFGLGVNF